MDNRRELIEGITVTPLRQIEDERGAVFHVLKNTDPHFNKFGEVYISKVNPGVVKAWKFHKEMTQNFCVPQGRLKLVLYDHRINSNTKGNFNEFLLDPYNNYKLITIPPKIWYGFQCLSDDYCLLLNVSDKKHDILESINEDISKFKIKWN